MRILPFIALPLLAALPLLGAGLSACSASDKGSGTTGTSTGGTTSTGGGATTTTSTSSSASGAGGDDGGLVLNIDAGTDDGSACQHLNIGILGNPGANPSSNFQTWLTMAGTSVQRIQTTATDPLTPAALQPFDVIVLDWLTRDYDATEEGYFTSFVTAGGGVVSMSGYNNTSADWHANSLLASMAVAYSGPLLNGPVTSFATHPITAGLTSVTFAGGYAIADLGGTTSTRTPIAFLPDPSGTGQVNVGYAIQMGSGRAFVWGDEWIEFDSQWSTQPQIKQLWVQIFAWISPANKCALTPPQ